VKNGAVLIEGSVRVPEGIVVEVHVPEANGRREAFDRVLAHRRLNAGYAADMTGILAEDRQARRTILTAPA